MESKIKIDLDNVQETLLLPLWGRATESQKEKPKLVDSKAVEIVNKIDYDFSTIAKNISWVSQLSWVARSLHVDKVIHNFISLHPNGTIVNIGCGFDTTFERIDNGKITFYDLRFARCYKSSKTIHIQLFKKGNNIWIIFEHKLVQSIGRQKGCFIYSSRSFLLLCRKSNQGLLYFLS